MSTSTCDRPAARSPGWRARRPSRASGDPSARRRARAPRPGRPPRRRWLPRPTTSRSSAVASSCTRPMRTMVWSSTTSTRTVTLDEYAGPTVTWAQKRTVPRADLLVPGRRATEDVGVGAGAVAGDSAHLERAAATGRLPGAAAGRGSVVGAASSARSGRCGCCRPRPRPRCRRPRPWPSSSSRRRPGRCPDVRTSCRPWRGRGWRW